MATLYLDWDDLDLRKGDRVAFEKDGKVVVGIIESVIEDEETGEIRIVAN